jgi:hypothetical protein
MVEGHSHLSFVGLARVKTSAKFSPRCRVPAATLCSFTIAAEEGDLAGPRYPSALMFMKDGRMHGDPRDIVRYTSRSRLSRIFVLGGPGRSASRV